MGDESEGCRGLREEQRTLKARSEDQQPTRERGREESQQREHRIGCLYQGASELGTTGLGSESEESQGLGGGLVGLEPALETNG